MSTSKIYMHAAVLASVIAIYTAPVMSEPAESREFDAALASSYKALAAIEKRQGDHRDAAAYAARAAAATAGNPTEPDGMQRHYGFLKQHYRGELKESRERLVDAFDKGGRHKAPLAAARAQTMFDCWIEQAAEDLQPDHVDACKKAYVLAVADVEKALIVPPEAVDGDTDQDGVSDSVDDCPGTLPNTPVNNRGCPEIPNLEGVHFGLDKSALTATARSILDEVATIMTNNSQIRIDIVGFTDSSGSSDYNQLLSQRRATTALEYLESAGVASGRMSANGRGEDSPVSSNGTKEGRAENRRVEITAGPL
ncbi:MAG: OmpA family protein [Gammaproteobacteria bacterium]